MHRAVQIIFVNRRGYTRCGGISATVAYLPPTFLWPAATPNSVNSYERFFQRSLLVFLFLMCCTSDVPLAHARTHRSRVLVVVSVFVFLSPPHQGLSGWREKKKHCRGLSPSLSASATTKRRGSRRRGACARAVCLLVRGASLTFSLFTFTEIGASSSSSSIGDCFGRCYLPLDRGRARVGSSSLSPCCSCPPHSKSGLVIDAKLLFSVSLSPRSNCAPKNPTAFSQRES